MAKVSTQVQPFQNSREQLMAALAYIDLCVKWAVARARAHGLNPEDEFRGLYISDEQVDTLLNSGVGSTLWAANGNGTLPGVDGPAMLQQARANWQAQTEVSRQAGIPMLLDQLVETFCLTPAETDALLMVLAPELDPRYERLFAYLQDDVTRKRPSVDLVLNLLTGSFSEKLSLRELFAPHGTLLGSQLVNIFADSGAREATLLAHYLRPAGNVIAFLLGQHGLDEQLSGFARLSDSRQFRPSPRVQYDLVEKLASVAAEKPLLSFRGSYGVGREETALCLAHQLGRPLLTLDLEALGASNLGLGGGLALALRDGRLHSAILYLTGWDSLLKDDRSPESTLRQLLAYPELVILTGEQDWQPAGRDYSTDGLRRRHIFQVHFDVPNFENRLSVWEHYLGERELDLSQVANHFRFSPGQIEDAIATAQDLARWEDEPLAEAHLFEASRIHSNQKLATLATKIRPRYTWNDIILPGDTFQQLHEMVNTVARKHIVYGQWGFDAKLALGKGLHALFAGEPGTGKTMSAEIMANELGLDLYKVDLSTLVSKYIGETEKNLDKIFSEAATSNAILFFDEADAIFGKRSEVKDAHDRYANIEVSYLLQRMETYDGVVILATNLRANLDEAFTRRLHFAIEFPFPEPVDRERIWRVTFPKKTPIGEDVDFKVLSQRFRLAGGNIKNIILAAAFLAAENENAVSMVHLLHAARREYQKMGRLIEESLFSWNE
ncbi:MAG: ATP-binding protein [Anaerolineales bacterium]|nr:ATP-binding protein [Anaerolineales bacterium]